MSVLPIRVVRSPTAQLILNRVNDALMAGHHISGADPGFPDLGLHEVELPAGLTPRARRSAAQMASEDAVEAGREPPREAAVAVDCPAYERAVVHGVDGVGRVP